MAKGFDPSELMIQARRMKEQIARTQEKLKDRVVEAESAGGMVKVFVNGNNKVVGVKINPEAVDPKDVTMLEDLVMVAVNKAMDKARQMSEDEMGKITGGMNIPGLF